MQYCLKLLGFLFSASMSVTILGTPAFATPMGHQLVGDVDGFMSLDFMAPHGADTNLLGRFSLFHEGVNYSSDTHNVLEQLRNNENDGGFQRDNISVKIGPDLDNHFRLFIFGSTSSVPQTYNGWIVANGEVDLATAFSGTYIIIPPTSSVPIPSTLLLFGLGFAGFAAWRKRADNQQLN